MLSKGPCVNSLLPTVVLLGEGVDFQKMEPSGWKEGRGRGEGGGEGKGREVTEGPLFEDCGIPACILALIPGHRCD